ncbi:hypothetical protein G9A89_011466 [Geosiphon pyriformis]|nr:hypothetical protein G9A89_011466 [Geosiphon pyriformis]
MSESLFKKQKQAAVNDALHKEISIDYVVQWFQVTPVTIQNCWQKTDILFYIQESETLIAMDIFNNLPLNTQ